MCKSFIFVFIFCYCKKFSKCPPCIDLLMDAGFVKSSDGKRLNFNRIYLKNMSNVMQQMADMI